MLHGAEYLVTASTTPMDKERFQDLLNDTFSDMRELTATKGREYAGSDDQLANFKRLGKALRMAPEAILFVYLTKHLDSITTYVRELQEDQLSEPIDGRIDDAILYLILLKGLTHERRYAKGEIGKA